MSDRELDKFLARRLFGLVLCTAAAHDVTMPREFCWADPESPDQGGELRSYSTSYEGMGEVLEAMGAQGWELAIWSPAYAVRPPEYCARFTGSLSRQEYTAAAGSMPLAVALASKSALESQP